MDVYTRYEVERPKRIPSVTPRRRMSYELLALQRHMDPDVAPRVAPRNFRHHNWVNLQCEFHGPAWL